MGEVSRFEGELTATKIQAFAREHGAHKPKASKQGDQWLLSSSVALPLHIADGNKLLLSDGQWCDLMQASGYEVPKDKAKQPPILNLKAASIKGHSWGGIRVFRQITMTRAEYSAIYHDYRGVKLSACGQFRFKVCKNPKHQSYSGEWCSILITDSKQHELIHSDSIVLDEEAVA